MLCTFSMQFPFLNDPADHVRIEKSSWAGKIPAESTSTHCSKRLREAAERTAENVCGKDLSCAAAAAWEKGIGVQKHA